MTYPLYPEKNIKNVDKFILQQGVCGKRDRVRILTLFLAFQPRSGAFRPSITCFLKKITYTHNHGTFRRKIFYKGGAMKLVINQGLDCDESEVIINCRYMDERLKRLAQYIEQFTFCLEGYRGDELLRVPIEKICYIESVDGRTLLYQEKEVFQSRESLIALEKLLSGTPFVRISKSCLVNISYLHCVRALMNHRMEATLQNGEKLLISRTYINDLKEKMKNY